MMSQTTLLSTKALYCFRCIVFQCDIGMIYDGIVFQCDIGMIYDEPNHTLINKGIALFLYIVFQCDIGIICDEPNHTLLNKCIVLFSLHCV